MKYQVMVNNLIMENLLTGDMVKKCDIGSSTYFVASRKTCTYGMYVENAFIHHYKIGILLFQYKLHLLDK